MSGTPGHMVRGGVRDDALWMAAFPIYYGLVFFYGAFASYYYIPAVHGATNSPHLAQFFGILIALSAILAFLGAFRTIKSMVRDPTPRDGLELIGQAAFVFLMLIYLASITLSLAQHDPGTRPGSSFVPECFAVFPAIRSAVIVRRMRSAKKRPTS